MVPCKICGSLLEDAFGFCYTCFNRVYKARKELYGDDSARELLRSIGRDAPISPPPPSPYFPSVPAPPPSSPPSLAASGAPIPPPAPAAARPISSASHSLSSPPRTNMER